MLKCVCEYVYHLSFSLCLSFCLALSLFLPPSLSACGACVCARMYAFVSIAESAFVLSVCASVPARASACVCVSCYRYMWPVQLLCLGGGQVVAHIDVCADQGILQQRTTGDY